MLAWLIITMCLMVTVMESLFLWLLFMFGVIPHAVNHPNTPAEMDCTHLAPPFRGFATDMDKG